MEDKTITPKSKKTSKSQHNFLLTVIGLLATLILSSLCVIGLLVFLPAQSQAAPHSSTVDRTAELEVAKTGETSSAGETAEISSPKATEKDEHQQGSRRIIDYPELATGENRIISYPPEHDGDHRIVSYDFIAPVADTSTEADPRQSHRIINYNDS